MAFLSRINISKRILLLGAASLLGLVLVLVLAAWQLDSALRQSFNNRTKQTIDVAYSQLERYHAEEVAGRMTREQAQEAAKQAVQSMRFGDNDYYFILDTGLKMVMHPVKPKLVGKDLTNETDADGKHHYQSMVEIANRDGAGFVDYNYKLPDGSGSKPKLSYTRKFAPWGWVVATGVFASEIRGAVIQSAISLGTVVLFVIVGLAALIWLISRSITVPLQASITRMRSLAEGDNQAPILGTDRRDELGEMALALGVFRDAAVAKEAAEAAKAQADADQKRVVTLLSDKLEGMSRGDLTNTMSETVPDSYAALKNNFNTALANLRDLIGALANASQSIHTGSNEIASASEDLARRTESNAASLEQSSAALSQMNDRIKSSTAVAERTAGSAEEAIKIVGSGRATAEEASGAMTRVSDSAKGIDSVIEGLDKIAFQTRVLAMNAAVEAGRAGEAGRGFAVVADLVSALAMRAEEEAKRARDQLTATQTDIVIAVDAVRKVDSALEDITGSVEQVHKYVETMASDNRAQASAIGEIAEAVNEMDRSTQQNAAMVEETSAAARNLAGEVETLASQSSRFNVGDDKPARRPAPAKSKYVPAPSAAPVTALPPSYAAADGDWASF